MTSLIYLPLFINTSVNSDEFEWDIDRVFFIACQRTNLIVLIQVLNQGHLLLG